MRRLDNNQSSGRLQVAMFLSILVYFGYISFLEMPSAVQQPITESEPSSQSVEVKAESNSILEQVEEAKAVEEKPVINEIALHSKEMSTDGVTIEVSSAVSAIKNTYLSNYTEPPSISTWWEWIFSREGAWTPYSEGDATLSILT